MHTLEGQTHPRDRSNVKPRIPLAYAALLITGLFAVVGFAAFSPGTSSEVEVEASQPVPAVASDVSARVASAVLALRVTEPETRIATTTTSAAPSSTPAGATVTVDETTTSLSPTSSVPETTTTTHAEASDDAQILAAPTTVAPTSTAAPTTTKAGDTTPPKIKVTSPHDGDTVTSSIVTFKGTSEPGAKVVSGPFAATMSDNGDWTIRLAVVPGANGARFTATDKAGNAATTRITVYFDEPAPAPAPPPPPPTTQTTTTTHADVTTTTKAPSTTTTTKAPTSSKWSPQWPADAGGIRNVENWRSTVAKYWPANRVDCVLGIIYRESKGDPRAYNASSSAEGLMQHLSKYWKSRAVGAGFVDGNGLVASPYNGAANIAAGNYLATYYDGAIGQWWNPWKSSNGTFTANYGSCTSSNPG